MKLIQASGWAALAVFLFSGTLVVLSSLPPKNITTVLQVNPVFLGEVFKGASNNASNVGLGQKQPGRIELAVTCPDRILVGEKGKIALNLMVTANPDHSGWGEPGEITPVSPLFDVYYLVGETRLEIFGTDLSPRGTISENITPNETARFEWAILPYQAGSVNGKMWVYLNLVPKSGGEAIRLTLLARPVEFRAENLFGFRPRTMRWAGAFGILFSIGMGVWGLGGRKRNPADL